MNEGAKKRREEFTNNERKYIKIRENVKEDIK